MTSLPDGLFLDVVKATDQEIAEIARTLSCVFVIPLADDDVTFISEAVARYEEARVLVPEDRQRLIDIVHTLLALNAN